MFKVLAPQGLAPMLPTAPQPTALSLRPSTPQPSRCGFEANPRLGRGEQNADSMRGHWAQGRPKMMKRTLRDADDAGEGSWHHQLPKSRFSFCQSSGRFLLGQAWWGLMRDPHEEIP